MQDTSDLYKSLYAGEHIVETRVTFGESGLLTDERGRTITFGTGSGTDRILVEHGGPESGFTEEILRSVQTHQKLFSGETPSVGNCVAGEIDIQLDQFMGSIARQARIVPYIRLTDRDRTEYSEWIQKGVYFIDTRDVTQNDDDISLLTIHGYDALAKAQADYPATDDVTYPALDTRIVEVIAAALGVTVDPRTYTVMTRQYQYGLPVGYSMQEVLSYIAASYAGNFVMTDNGQLRLVTLTELPEEGSLLTDEVGYALVFGYDGEETRIIVG